MCRNINHTWTTEFNLVKEKFNHSMTKLFHPNFLEAKIYFQQIDSKIFVF